ncbi:hypothetical protein [Streptomyces sp. NRRL S-87]|uniref:hypothetical protein n=1 Tax=Streptomyces sp. NRRL S-87 TaxID=1463920 RepID=UPI00056C20BB|nr:hypothetical protein [Streptomyces sp. NRRL S-87]
MPQRDRRVQDLVVFLAVLGTSVALVLRGAAPESLAAVAVVVSGLYAAWRGDGGRGGDGPGRDDRAAGGADRNDRHDRAAGGADRNDRHDRDAGGADRNDRSTTP